MSCYNDEINAQFLQYLFAYNSLSAPERLLATGVVSYEKIKWLFIRLSKGY